MNETKRLPVVLTEDELAVRSQELAKAVGDLEETDEARKASASFHGAEVKAARAVVARLSKVVRERREYRDVEVKDVFDYAEKRVDTVRLDTGERVWTRAMTEDERQVPMLESVRGEKP